MRPRHPRLVCDRGFSRFGPFQTCNDKTKFRQIPSNIVELTLLWNRLIYYFKGWNIFKGRSLRKKGDCRRQSQIAFLQLRSRQVPKTLNSIEKGGHQNCILLGSHTVNKMLKPMFPNDVSCLHKGFFFTVPKSKGFCKSSSSQKYDNDESKCDGMGKGCLISFLRVMHLVKLIICLPCLLTYIAFLNLFLHQTCNSSQLSRI